MKNRLEDLLRSQGGRLDKEIPDPAVLHRILEHMQEKHSRKHQTRFILLRTWQWAAACILIVLSGVLFWVQKQGPLNQPTSRESISRLPQKDSREKDALATTVAAGKTSEAKRNSGQGLKGNLTARKQALPAKINMRASDPAKGVICAGLKDTASPASRISAANSAYTLKHLDSDVVNALVETLNTDPSANVRLAVLDGLAQSKQGSYVRKKLVASLQQQQDPVVQIALINLLTGMGESGILRELDKIVKDDNTMKGVKDCAYASIFRLRSS